METLKKINLDDRLFATHVHIGGRKAVLPAEVILFQADLNYSTVHFIDGRKLVVATTLKKLEERFAPFAFLRMNKKYLINTQFVAKKLDNGLELTNSQVIKFSRRKGKAYLENA